MPVRSDEEFRALKEEIPNQVTELNAEILHEHAVKLVLENLQNLDLEVIDRDNQTEIEDLYLNVALFIHTASYIAAQKKAIRKQMSFEDAYNDIGTDEVMGVLINTIAKYSDVTTLLGKFLHIDKFEWLTGCEEWAGFHARMGLLAGIVNKNFIASNELYKKNLDALEDKLRIQPQEQEKGLFIKARNILQQVKKIAGKHPENLSINDFKDINDILICANTAWDDRNNKEKTILHSQELARLAQKISGKPSPKWKALGISLLTFSCAALVVIGILAAIPSGGSSLLLAAIGSAGLAASVGVGVSIAAAGAVSLHHGGEQERAKSTGELKNKINELRNNEPDNHQPNDDHSHSG